MGFIPSRHLWGNRYRIRELRERAGLTLAQLAEMVGTTQPQLTRLERGERRLTADWMARIATALKVQPVDLLAEATLAEFGDEVEPYVGDDAVKLALAGRRLRIYKVISDSVARAGLLLGSLAVFDCSAEATSKLENGSIVIAQVTSMSDGQKRLILRQYLAPDLLVSNRPGANTVISLGGSSVLKAEITCVRLPNEAP